MTSRWSPASDPVSARADKLKPPGRGSQLLVKASLGVLLGLLVPGLLWLRLDAWTYVGGPPGDTPPGNLTLLTGGLVGGLLGSAVGLTGRGRK